MRVRYTRRAQSDLESIYTYLDQRAPAAARAVKELIERRIASLADFPSMAPETEELGCWRRGTDTVIPHRIKYKKFSR